MTKVTGYQFIYNFNGYIAIVKGLKNTINGCPQKEVTLLKTNDLPGECFGQMANIYKVASYGNDVQAIQEAIKIHERNGKEC